MAKVEQWMKDARDDYFEQESKYTQGLMDEVPKLVEIIAEHYERWLAEKDGRDEA